MMFARTIVMTMLAALLTSASAAHADGLVVHDARGRDVAIQNPTRIVAIGGAITEILYALGIEDRIAGVDSTSLYPASALRDKPNVGYMRKLSAEGVLGLNPSLVLAMQGSGPKEVIDILDAAKVPLVLVPETFSEQGLIDKISLVGHAMGVEARSACLSRAVTADLAQLHELQGKIAQPRRVMFVMSLINGRAMVAGQNTAANEIIRMAGAVNAVADYDGYKAITDEAIVAAKPDAVVTIMRGDETLQADAIYQHAAFALTPAATGKAFIAMDGLYLLGFGPRTASAARDLAVKLYPDLASSTQTAVPAPNCRHG